MRMRAGLGAHSGVWGRGAWLGHAGWKEVGAAQPALYGKESVPLAWPAPVSCSVPRYWWQGWQGRGRG